MNIVKLHSISSNDYHFIKQIGVGSFGEVFIAKNAENEMCAVKRLKMMDKKLKTQHYMELRAAKLFNHPNIVNTKNVFVYNGKLCLEQEFCSGTLESLLQRRLCQQERKIIYFQLLKGLEYLHSQCFVHRDLKPDNILVQFRAVDKSDVLETMETFIKIMDFGLGTFVGHTPYGQYKSSGPGHCWTDGWRPPEVVFGWPDYGTSADIFSMGLVFLYVCCKTNPFALLMNPNQQFDRIFANYQLDKERVRSIVYDNAEGGAPLFLREMRIEDDELQFLESMLQLNFRKRLSCSELLSSEFLKSVDSIVEIGQDILAPLEPLVVTQFMSLEQLQSHGLAATLND